MQEAMNKKGFSFVEIISQCPTSFGKRVGQPEGIDQLMEFKKNSISLKKAEKYSEKELENKIVTGKFVERDRPEFVDGLQAINDRV